MPEFVSVNAKRWGIRAVTLTAELTSSRVDECGFIICDGLNNTTRITASIEDNIFSVSPKTYWLKFNSTYTVKAFFRVGDQEFLSEEFSFSIGDTLVIVEADDEAFYDYLIENFDTNGDGDIDYDEAKEIKSITLGPRGVKTLRRGLENLQSLVSLDCSGNLLTEIDVTPCPSLTFLDCSPMEDESHRNLLELVRISRSEYQLIKNLTENKGERNAEYVPEGTIVCAGFEDGPRIGEVVEAGGAEGIIFWTDGKDALVVSVDEISGKDWNASLNWCKSYGDGSWDMPDIDQLILLSNHFYKVTKSLRSGGFTELYNHNGFYWSSTENQKFVGYYYSQRLWDCKSNTNASFDEHTSSLSNRTRAVRMITLE